MAQKDLLGGLFGSGKYNLFDGLFGESYEMIVEYILNRQVFLSRIFKTRRSFFYRKFGD